MVYYNIFKVPNEKHFATIEQQNVFPNNTYFINSDGEKKFTLNDNNVYIYGTTTKPIGLINQPQLVLCNDLSCPTGYSEYQLDTSRVLNIGTAYGLSGTKLVDDGYAHTGSDHSFTTGSDKSHDVINTYYRMTLTGDKYLLLSYTSFKLCIADNLNYRTRGYYE